MGAPRLSLGSGSCLILGQGLEEPSIFGGVEPVAQWSVYGGERGTHT